MRILKIVAIVLVVYVGIVVLFESSIGYWQPQPGGTLVITTFDEKGAPHDRVVSKLDHDGKLYVAVNHWPRAWYKRTLVNPDVQVAIDGSEKGNYKAVPISGPEYDEVNRKHALPFVFRVVTGFPPRLLLRLDPR
jgi:hypothetical protein